MHSLVCGYGMASVDLMGDMISMASDPAYFTNSPWNCSLCCSVKLSPTSNAKVSSILACAGVRQLWSQ